MNKFTKLIHKFCRGPGVVEMLFKIEWAQLRTRGMGGYFHYHQKSLRNRITKEYPTAIQIEPHGSCNIRCAMCFQGYMKLPGDRNMMDLELYKRIIDQISPVTPMLYLYWRGEPLLHADLGSMIKYAKNKHMYVFVSTNAVTLDEEKAQEFINSGLDFLLIGFDGASKETFEAMRRGAKFERICQNIQTLVYLKKMQGTLLPHVCLQFIVSAVNAHELPMAKRLYRELGADSFIEKTLDTYENFDNDRIKEHLQSLFVQGTFSKYEYQKGELVYSGHSYCEMPRRMVIRADGELSLCCYDMQGEYTIGSVDGHNLLELWQSPSYVELRAKGQHRKLPLCVNCGAGIQK